MGPIGEHFHHIWGPLGPIWGHLQSIGEPLSHILGAPGPIGDLQAFLLYSEDLWSTLVVLIWDLIFGSQLSRQDLSQSGFNLVYLAGIVEKEEREKITGK